MGRPPPLIRAMPERKRFFFIDVFPYAPIIKAKTSSQATLLCGVAAEAELLRPAILVVLQNSCNNTDLKYETMIMIIK